MIGEQITGGLRRPLFVVALVVVCLVVVVEIGMSLLIASAGGESVDRRVAADLGVDPGVFGSAVLAPSEPPGAGIGALAFVDGLLAFTLLMLGLSLILQLRLYGRIQGVVTLVVTLLWVLGSVIAAVFGIATLMLMVGLFVSAPFGTIAYLAIWGWFPTGDAAVVLSLLFLLKLVFGVLLVLAQPKFLRVRGLVALVVVSVVLQLALGVIHGFLPGPLVSIGDQLWAIVTIVVALVWALVTLIGAIPAIVKAVRVSGSLAE